MIVYPTGTNLLFRRLQGLAHPPFFDGPERYTDYGNQRT